MKRLLICSSTFPLGSEDKRTAPFVYKLAAALAARVDVVALAPHHAGAALRERLGPVEVHRFRYFLPAAAQRLADGAGIMPNLRRSLLAKVQAPAYLAAFRAAAVRLVRTGGFDALNSHWLIPSAWAAGPPARGARLPHVISIHAADVFLLKRLPGGRRLAAPLLREAAAVFGDSQFILDETSDLVGFDVKGTPTTPGVDAAAFAPRYSTADAKERLGWEQTPTLLFVGRMVEKKGLPYLLDALAAARKENAGLKLVLVGNGPGRPSVEAKTRALGLADAVTFAGVRGHDELGGYYNACDALVVPSVVDRGGETEGMPTVIVEAFAAACPVIGSRVAGIPEFVRDGVTGYLAAPKDADDLAARILRIIKEGKERFRDDCLRAAAGHTFDAIALLYAKAIGV